MSLRRGIVEFLSATCPGAQVAPIVGDASGRRFFRVTDSKQRTSVIMDYGEPFNGTTDDQWATGVFESAGLPVPRILAASAAAGCLVLEDLGTTSFESALESAGAASVEARSLLERSVDLAARIVVDGTPSLDRNRRPDGACLDAGRFRFEMGFFAEHYAEGLVRSRVSPELRDALTELADQAAATPRPVLCHRDFHSRNILVRDDGSLAMVDIQDARLGPDSYDLASLLFDCYVDIEPTWVRELIERYRRAVGIDGDADFLERFHLVAAQRMIKALGTFGNQIHVLGRDRYRTAIPRTLTRLNALLPARNNTTRLHTLLVAAGLLGSDQPQV